MMKSRNQLQRPSKRLILKTISNEKSLSKIQKKTSSTTKFAEAATSNFPNQSKLFPAIYTNSTNKQLIISKCNQQLYDFLNNNLYVGTDAKKQNLKRFIIKSIVQQQKICNALKQFIKKEIHVELKCFKDKQFTICHPVTVNIASHSYSGRQIDTLKIEKETKITTLQEKIKELQTRSNDELALLQQIERHESIAKQALSKCQKKYQEIQCYIRQNSNCHHNEKGKALKLQQLKLFQFDKTSSFEASIIQKESFYSDLSNQFIKCLKNIVLEDIAVLNQSKSKEIGFKLENFVKKIVKSYEEIIEGITVSHNQRENYIKLFEEELHKYHQLRVSRQESMDKIKLEYSALCAKISTIVQNISNHQTILDEANNSILQKIDEKSKNRFKIMSIESKVDTRVKTQKKIEIIKEKTQKLNPTQHKIEAELSFKQQTQTIKEAIQKTEEQITQLSQLFQKSSANYLTICLFF